MNKLPVLHGVVSPPVWWNNPDPPEPAKWDDWSVTDSLWARLTRWSQRMNAKVNPANPHGGLKTVQELQLWIAKGHELWLNLREELGWGYRVSFWPCRYDLRFQEDYPLPQ